MAEGKLDSGLQVSELAAAVVALAREAVGVDGFFLHQRRDAVGELNLAARAVPDLLQVLENRRGQDITADDRQIGRRLGGFRLFNDAVHAAGGRLIRLYSDNAVLVGIGLRNDLNPEHAGTLRFVDVRHLPQAGDLALDQVVRQVDEERLRAHCRLRTQHRVAQSERRRLPNVDARCIGRKDTPQLVEQVAFTLRFEHMLEFLVGIEVILNGAL